MKLLLLHPGTLRDCSIGLLLEWAVVGDYEVEYKALNLGTWNDLQLNINISLEIPSSCF